MRHITAQGLFLIKSFEEFRSSPYQDSAGVWTIGYGHTAGVSATSHPINEAEAEQFLYADLNNAQSQVMDLIHVLLNDNQYSALVSLTYNAGTAPLEKTLGTLLNAGDYDAAAQQFLKWIYVGGEISGGLVRRRAAEKALFLNPAIAAS